MKIYVVEYGFDYPVIASVKVLRQTEKSYMVDRVSVELKFGSYCYVGKRVSKDNPNVFLSLVDACEYVKALADEKIDKAEKKIAVARDTIACMNVLILD